MARSTGFSAGTDPLASPAIGTAPDDLIRKCALPAPERRDPTAPPRDPAIAVALSGGGFRATLAGLGVLRFLADAGLLAQVRSVSSVSGGSIVTGKLAVAWSDLEADGFAASTFDEIVTRPILALVTRRSLQRDLVGRWLQILGPDSRTDALADLYDRHLFQGKLLEELPATCRFIFNSANATTGVRFGFEGDVLGDYVTGLAATKGTGLRVAQAVAASCAYPGAFAPFVPRGVTFPCRAGKDLRLIDGGAYDNSGLEPIDRHGPFIVGLNAGGQFRTGGYGGLPFVADFKRVASLLYRQTTALRMRAMVDRFKAWEDAETRKVDPPEWARRGVVFGLATTLDATAEWTAGRPADDRDRLEAALAATTLGKMPPELAQKLVYRGWWLTGATITRYHGPMIASPYPSWRPL